MRQTWLVPACLLVLNACASGGGSALYRKEVGIASGRDALRVIQSVAQQYTYEIESADTTREVRVETEWLKRRPFEDESALGIEDAESRLIVVGRPRGSNALGTSYSVMLTVENRLRAQGMSTWSESLNTAMFKAYADRIANTMKEWFTNIGTRVY
jgi:hypothetical protein